MIEISEGKLQDTKVVLHFAIYFENEEVSEKLLLDSARNYNLNVLKSNTEEINTIFVELIDNVRESNPIFPIESLKYFAKGIPESDYSKVYSKNRALHIVFTYNPATNIRLYNSLVHFIEAISNQLNGFIWDDESRLLYSRQYWSEKVVPAFYNDYPEIRSHISIHQYQQDENLIRSITLGLRKFGLADLVVQSSPRYLSAQNSNLLTLLGQYMLENTNIEIKGQFDLDVNKIKSPNEKDIQKSSIISGGNGFGSIFLENALIEDGDPQNRIFSVFFMTFNIKDQLENQNSFYSDFYGSYDSVIKTKHEDRLLAASEEAKKKFASYYEKFHSDSFLPGEMLLVKAPFDTISGGNEWMWVEIQTWKDKKINGILQNDPNEVPLLKAGSSVEISQDEIFDYIYYKTDGSYEGNETGKILEELNK